MPQQSAPIAGDTALAIAASIERAIHGRRLAPGQVLPTIRELASNLNVSPATVAAAYRVVQTRGLVIGEGRRGTRVRPALSLTHRAAESPDLPEDQVDLASGNPDPAFLPPLEPALRGLTTRPHLYGEPLQLRALLAFAAGEFSADGIRSDSLVVTGGALDGIERILREHVRKGDRVAVEDPTLPALIELIGAMGFTIEPFDVDVEGPTPDSFERALRRRVRAAILTPRAQNPTGAALTVRRCAELKRLLRSFHDVLIIENDAVGAVAGAEARTVCAESHPHWAVVRSMSKCLGPDLRVAVTAGDHLTIERVQRRQGVGARWVSHLLQRLALALWSDPSNGRLFARAADVYAQRRAALIRALEEHGVRSVATSGFNIWIPVRDEASTVHALAQRRWAVAAGERFRIQSDPGIRVTTSALAPAEAQRFAADLVAIHRPATAVFA